MKGVWRKPWMSVQVSIQTAAETLEGCSQWPDSPAYIHFSNLTLTSLRKCNRSCGLTQSSKTQGWRPECIPENAWRWSFLSLIPGLSRLSPHLGRLIICHLYALLIQSLNSCHLWPNTTQHVVFRLPFSGFRIHRGVHILLYEVIK